MSRTLHFEISFFGPFRVASGSAARGADVSVDSSDPLPATSLKGLMRDAAITRLGLEQSLVDKVFGSTAEPSPWSWTSGEVETVLRTRTRVRIDPEIGVVETGGLVVGEELWSRSTGSFHVVQRLRIAMVDGLSVDDHTSVLQASAAAVHSMGADRQRGFGWIAIAPKPKVPDWGEVLCHLADIGSGGRR